LISVGLTGCAARLGCEGSAVYRGRFDRALRGKMIGEWGETVPAWLPVNTDA